MENKPFSEWVKEQHELNNAGDSYEAINEHGKKVIDYAIERYIGYKAAQSKGGWTEEDLEQAFEAGMSYESEPNENYDWERWLQNQKDFKTQQAIYKNYPNLNASKEEMDEMRKLK